MNALHIVCPHCSAINRIPATRLHDQPNCGQCHRRMFDASPVELDANSLTRHLSRSDVPLLIDFWAPWCDPCKMMAPAYAQAAAKLEPRVRVAKLNTEAVRIGTDFNIRSIPTLVLFDRGREVARQSGAMSAVDIRRWTESHLPR